ncbi:cyclic nucleotide-binding protein [Sorangium cellulosum]|uniref:Cyclic nucleotide-binding protein n=1 Tax=Sorangium cellulosum TaxID=56 RepID=A0A2L0F9N0_SORCE|nr:cyclic nucleotide-binding domain-containing protein [Sorangium cellulosum]AUX48243.1 cyclic nucleotide-binding protein [Sorangium cellulosum]
MSRSPELNAQLREIGLFGGLSDQVLAGLADTLELVELQPGAVAFREGDSGREMFVLLEGEMEVLKRSKREVEARVAVLGPSDWFGEMSILDVMPRSATVRAIAPSRLMRVTAQDLDALYRRDLKSYTLLVLNIAREMSRRLRVADSLLAELVANMLDEYARPRRPAI